MYCRTCGLRLGDGARFCAACGSPADGDGPGPVTRSAWRGRVLAFGVGLVLAGAAAAGAWVVMEQHGTGGAEDDRQPVALPESSEPPESSASADVEESPSSAPATSAGRSADFAQLFDDTATGVFMVRATTCAGSGVGSAFLVGDDLVMTAAHVVTEAASVVVVQDDIAHSAVVIGIDEANDIALLETTDQIRGHQFSLADAPSSAGDAVAVIGHPLGEPLTITSGTASRVDRDLWPDFQIDVSVNPGNSGGPVIRGDGDVVGMAVAKDAHAEGLAYAVRVELLAERLADPGLLVEPAVPRCDAPLGPDEGYDVPVAPSSDALSDAVAATLASYFEGINIGDYQWAFDQLSPRRQGDSSVDDFASGLVTSYDFGFEVLSVDETESGVLVWLEFVSIQAPEFGPDGEACTNWSLDYELIWDSVGYLLIDRVTGHGDKSGHAPCN
jgi:serine protease Do